ncbi:hypothetical protein E2C01_009574 [Portunus trituberculatus]|uniref:Uncharacterized protein n=1 Tax=Portunus trituberculatus TaxID=210409 RepID=A0A5B7D648_PORTR|nr:hypothetical protein [Portunus trituberculatus]
MENKTVLLIFKSEFYNPVSDSQQGRANPEADGEGIEGKRGVQRVLIDYTARVLNPRYLHHFNALLCLCGRG